MILTEVDLSILLPNPLLFPNGKGEFVACRRKKISYINWLRHLLMQSSRTFARHTDFMFVAIKVLRDS